MSLVLRAVRFCGMFDHNLPSPLQYFWYQHTVVNSVQQEIWQSGELPIKYRLSGIQPLIWYNVRNNENPGLYHDQLYRWDSIVLQMVMTDDQLT